MPGTVLLIEDEESIPTLVTAYLERDGFQPKWMPSGQEDLAARSPRYSLAILPAHTCTRARGRWIDARTQPPHFRRDSTTLPACALVCEARTEASSTG